MRLNRILPLVAVVLTVAATHRANAQADTAAPKAGASTEPWTARPVGAYVLQLQMPEHPMDVNLTIADSSGTLVALFWPVGEYDGHNMNVDVHGSDLVLTADSPRGPIRLVLQHQGARITGTWSAGAEHGMLTGAPKAKG